MNTEIIFSIIIPTYNRERIISRAIDSVLCQTFKDFELIIIDDGSKDNTQAVIEAYNDDRIKYIYKENGGQNSALNKGLELAKGKYIAFLDSDDEWFPTKLEKTYQKYCEDEQISVVYNLTGIKDEHGKVKLARDDYLEGTSYANVLTQGYLTSPSFLSCKKSCFDEIGLLDLSFTYCQDDDLCFSLAKVFKIALVKEILGIYNVDADDQMMSSNHFNSIADGWWKLWSKYEKDVLQYCGKEVLAKHYLECTWHFIAAGNLEMQKIALAKSIENDFCFETICALIAMYVPNYILRIKNRPKKLKIYFLWFFPIFKMKR